MRSMLTLTAGMLLGVLVAGCATMTIGSHMDRTASFHRYRTFAWGPADNLPVGDPRLENNPFFKDYLQGAVERHLRRRGITLADRSDDADLLVHYHASVTQRFDVAGIDHTAGIYHDGYQPRVIDFEQGSIVLDVVDNRTSTLVWRGWAQQALNGLIDSQDRLEREIERAVTRMLTQLPR